jgi:hypothetical protein
MYSLVRKNLSFSYVIIKNQLIIHIPGEKSQIYTECAELPFLACKTPLLIYNIFEWHEFYAYKVLKYIFLAEFPLLTTVWTDCLNGSDNLLLLSRNTCR